MGERLSSNANNENFPEHYENLENRSSRSSWRYRKEHEGKRQPQTDYYSGRPKPIPIEDASPYVEKPQEKLGSAIGGGEQERYELIARDFSLVSQDKMKKIVQENYPTSGKKKHFIMLPEQNQNSSDTAKTSPKPVYVPVTDEETEVVEAAQRNWEGFQVAREVYGVKSEQKVVDEAKAPNGHPQNDVREKLDLQPITQEELDDWRAQRTKPRSATNPQGWVQWSEVKKEEMQTQPPIQLDNFRDWRTLPRSPKNPKGWVQKWT